ncbi:hypothetical protein PROFUN_15882 [Planoprotostelium fungivorum]|uniref:Fungal lipase-type domain-containing protein n=1 Tax=Planoprotostelium fungivorum TaxID=1890364 RepID=A0A2P6MU62_9EUKA|nr:hypothetical protein PROFUN_15882 [Planoprotostelium fungivorum]
MWKTSLYVVAIAVIAGVAYGCSSFYVFLFGVILFHLSIAVISVSAKFGFRLTKRLIVAGLWVLHYLLLPVSIILSNIPGLRTVVNFFFVFTVAFWFRVLLLFDRGLRKILSSTDRSLRHPSGTNVSIVNSPLPDFQPCGDFDDFHVLPTVPLHYSENAAISCGNIARLVYEDVPLIRYELKKGGFEDDTLRLIHYHNTVGFCARKGNRIIVVFRGTDPLNLMHIFTDLRLGQVSLSELDDRDEKGQVGDAPERAAGDVPDSMGRVHYGFVRALRLSEKPAELRRSLQRRDSEQREKRKSRSIAAEKISIELSNHTLGDTFKSALVAFAQVFKFFWSGIWMHSVDPVDTKFSGRSERHVTAYEQAAQAIEAIWVPNGQVIVCGHSLGGALAQVFFTQCVHERKPWIENTYVYTYGAPRVGNSDYVRYMSDYASKMFRIVNNNDIIPRIPGISEDFLWFLPTWSITAMGSSGGKYETYADNPGHLIYIDGADGTVLVDPREGIPDIQVMALNGILDTHTIWRMRYESTVRVIFRLLLPFCMNDHLPSDYVQMIKLHKKLNNRLR